MTLASETTASKAHAARFAAVLCGLLLPAAAKPGTSHHAPDAPSNVVSTVTVTATREAPKVVSTFPARDAKVAPGLLVLRVSFDQHMRDDGWSYEPSAKGAYPDCGATPRLLDDKKTFVLICRTLPSKTYAVWFNQPPIVDFSNLSRHSAEAYELTFTTTADDPVRTLAAAMKADPALSTLSNPVEPEGERAPGQPREAPGEQ